MGSLLKISLLAIFSIALVISGYADVVLKKIATKQGPRWLLENDQVRAEIDPARGGRISSFIDKSFKVSMII